MNRLFFLLLIMLNVTCIKLAWSQETNDLHTVQKVATITSTLSESHPIVRQKVAIKYLIAVPGYFNGSTQFQLPSLSKVQLARDSDFAVNGNTIIEGEKYATQLWQVNLYPEQAGLLELPALHFNVQYVDNNGNQQKVTLQSDSLSLFSYLPESLKGVKQFVVSTDVDVSEQWSKNSNAYQVGDIIQREITITANDINSIEIPQVSYQMVDGVQMNVQEAQLDDESNRGQHVATMKQTITYVVKQGGRYQLGGESLDWWDSEDGLQQASFEQHEIKVAGINPWYIKVFVITGIFVILFLLILLKIKKMPASLHSQLKIALKNKNWALLITLLYQKADQDVTLGLLKEGKQSETASELLSMYYQQPDKTVNTLNDSTLKELIK